MSTVLIRLNVDNIDFEIHQHPELITNFRDYEGQQIQSTSIWVRNLNKTDFDRVESIVRDFSELLSFACAAQIRKYAYKYDQVTPSEAGHAIPGVCQFGKPVLPRPVGDVAVRVFLEKTWANYHRLRDVRQLHVVIDYLALNQLRGIPQELQLMMTFTTLENLKGTYAKSKGIPFIKPAFRKISNPPKSDPAREPRYSFESLLGQMLLDMGMKPALSKVIELRNEIIHSGISQISFDQQNEILGFSQDLIREYLLRLLGFTGSYCSYAEPNGRHFTI
jgi:hypothetical protein